MTNTINNLSWDHLFILFLFNVVFVFGLVHVFLFIFKLMIGRR